MKATPPADLPLGLLYWRVAATDGGSGIGTYTSGSFTKEWGARADDHLAGSRRHLRLPDAARAVPLAAAHRRQVVHARDRRRDGLRGRELVHDEQHELHADRAADDQPDVLLAAPGDVDHRRRGHRLERDPPVHLHLVDGPDAADAGRRRRHAVRDITFSWSPVVGAKTYQIQISPNGDWDNNVIHDAHGQEHEVHALHEPRQRLVLLARPGEGREGHAQQRPLVQRAPVHPRLAAASGRGCAVLRRHHDADRRCPDARVDAGAARLALRDLDRHRPATSRPAIVRHVSHEPDEGHALHADERRRRRPGGCSLPYSPGTTYYWKVRAIDAARRHHRHLLRDEPSDTWRYIYIGDLPTLVTPADNATVEVPTLHLGSGPEHRALRPDGQEARRRDRFHRSRRTPRRTRRQRRSTPPTVRSRGTSRRSTATAKTASFRRAPTGSTSRSRRR